MKRMLLLFILCVAFVVRPLSASAQIQKTPDVGTVNSQTGTSYTFVFSDRGKLVTFSNGSAVSVTLPQATGAGNFRSGWTTFVYNLGAGTVTIAPSTSTINGSASIALATGEGASIFSNGSNYLAFRTTVSTIANKIHETSDPTDLTVGAILDGEILVRSGSSIVSIPLPEGGSGGIGTVTTTGSPASGNLAKFSGATSITNGDLSGDVTTSGTLTTTIANNAVTNAKIANSTIDLTAKVTGALPAANINSSVLDDSVAYCADAGSNDTYTCSLSPAPAAYVNGAHYRFTANTANTGAATINFNSLGAKTIKKLHDQDLADNDIESGSVVDLVYDGTNMQMQSQIANSSGGSIAPLQLTNANTVEQYNGTTAQTFRVYGTRTSSTNYEAVKLDYDSGNGAFRIEAEKGSGGGSFRRFFILVSGGIYQFNSGSFEPPGDGAQTLGGNLHYWSQIFGNDYITLAGGKFRWAGRARMLSPADGYTQITTDGGNPGTIANTARALSQITSNQNNYDIAVPAYFLRASSDASRDITGMIVSNTTRQDGETHLFINVGSNDIVLKHENASSTAANRFLNSTGADITLSANQAADIIYDGTSQRWRVFKRN